MTSLLWFPLGAAVGSAPKRERAQGTPRAPGDERIVTAPRQTFQDRPRSRDVPATQTELRERQLRRGTLGTPLRSQTEEP